MVKEPKKLIRGRVKYKSDIFNRNNQKGAEGICRPEVDVSFDFGQYLVSENQRKDHISNLLRHGRWIGIEVGFLLHYLSTAKF